MGITAFSVAFYQADTNIKLAVLRARWDKFRYGPEAPPAYKEFHWNGEIANGEWHKLWLVCRHCDPAKDKPIRWDAKEATASNLKRHLVRKHNWEEPSVAGKRSENVAAVAALKFYDPEAVKMTKSVLEMMVTDKIPFDLAGRKGLRHMLRRAVPG